MKRWYTAVIQIDSEYPEGHEYRVVAKSPGQAVALALDEALGEGTANHAPAYENLKRLYHGRRAFFWERVGAR